MPIRIAIAPVLVQVAPSRKVPEEKTLLHSTLSKSRKNSQAPTIIVMGHKSKKSNSVRILKRLSPEEMVNL